MENIIDASGENTGKEIEDNWILYDDRFFSGLFSNTVYFDLSVDISVYVSIFISLVLPTCLRIYSHAGTHAHTLVVSLIVFFKRNEILFRSSNPI